MNSDYKNKFQKNLSQNAPHTDELLKKIRLQKYEIEKNIQNTKNSMSSINQIISFEDSRSINNNKNSLIKEALRCNKTDSNNSDYSEPIYPDESNFKEFSLIECYNNKTLNNQNNTHKLFYDFDNYPNSICENDQNYNKDGYIQSNEKNVHGYINFETSNNSKPIKKSSTKTLETKYLQNSHDKINDPLDKNFFMHTETKSNDINKLEYFNEKKNNSLIQQSIQKDKYQQSNSPISPWSHSYSPTERFRSRNTYSEKEKLYSGIDLQSNNVKINLENSNNSVTPRLSKLEKQLKQIKRAMGKGISLSDSLHIVMDEEDVVSQSLPSYITNSTEDSIRFSRNLLTYPNNIDKSKENRCSSRSSSPTNSYASSQLTENSYLMSYIESKSEISDKMQKYIYFDKKYDEINGDFNSYNKKYFHSSNSLYNLKVKDNQENSDLNFGYNKKQSIKSNNANISSYSSSSLF